MSHGWLATGGIDIENRDVGVEDYETLETRNIKLPVLSLCIENPFIPKKLADIDPTINSTSYLQYLKGEIYEEKYEQIDYENVTIDLEHYMKPPLIKMFNDSNLHSPQGHAIKYHVNFNGLYGGYEDKFVKCFEVVG